ncbi:hypothetical protein ABIF62_009426 [Bradyrhizobium japonicum]
MPLPARNWLAATATAIAIAKVRTSRPSPSASQPRMLLIRQNPLSSPTAP